MLMPGPRGIQRSGQGISQENVEKVIPLESRPTFFFEGVSLLDGNEGEIEDKDVEVKGIKTP